MNTFCHSLTSSFIQIQTSATSHSALYIQFSVEEHHGVSFYSDVMYRQLLNSHEIRHS